MSEGIWIKKSLVAAVAAGTLVLAGCNDEETENKTEGTSTSQETSSNPSNYQTVNNPRGSITGLVTDTNGYPIQGATVYLGEQTATTNAGGQYYFSDVAVTRTVKNDSDEYAQALALTIVAPEGYLGATVTVMPQAQIFNGSGDENEVTNPVTTFVDGFNASAGTAALPATTASVEGTLRHSITGEAISGVRLSMDLESTSVGVDQEQPQDGVKTTYATSSISATSGSNGAFTFTGVPTDAVLRLAAEGYTVAQSIDTSDEDTLVSLGGVMATPILSYDEISPWVKSVAEVVSSTASRGMLNDDVTKTITVKFSETLQSIAEGVDVNSLRVRDVTGADYLEHTATLSGDTLTITLADNLPADHEIDLVLLKGDFKDTAGNALGINDGNGDPSLVGYDYEMLASNDQEYVRIQLKGYDEANDNATKVETIAQQKSDETGVNELDLIQTDNHVFLDVDDETADIQQLNASADNNGDNEVDSAKRLTALLQQVAGTLTLDDKVSVEVDTALVHFTPTNASKYRIELVDAQRDEKWSGLASKDLKGPGELDLTNAKYGLVTPDGNQDIALLVDGVVPGDIMIVTPLDDFGYEGTPSELVLADNVAPTTVLQSSYGMGDDDNGKVTSLRYGDGGEQSADVDVLVGTPYLDLTPRLLGEVNGTAEGSQDDAAYTNTFKRLYSHNLVDPNDPSGDAFIDPALNIYDKSALSDYLGDEDFAREIAVAFSEDLAEDLVGTPVFTSKSGSLVPSNFVVRNNVAVDDNGTNTNADLVSFDITDIYTFALQQSGAVLDFTGAVQDTAGNVADVDAKVNPKVVVRDMIPPMVVSATYQGRSLSVVFDKPIDISGIDDPNTTNTDETETALTIGEGANAVNVDLSEPANYTWDDGSLTLTVYLRDNVEGDFENLGYSAFETDKVFTLAQYDDDDASANIGSDELYLTHAPLDFSNIPNMNGAKWSDYDTADAEGKFSAPTFAMQNTIETFSANAKSVSSTSGANPTLVVTYEFDHEVNWSDVDGDAEAQLPGELSSEEIQGMFTLGDGTAGSSPAIKASGNSVNISQKTGGGVEYTFTLALDGLAQTGNELAMDAPTVTSAYDGTKTVTVGAVSVP